MFLIIVWLFIVTHSKVELLSDNINPKINEKIVVSQVELSQFDHSTRIEKNYYIDINTLQPHLYTWAVNTWGIVNERAAIILNSNKKLIHKYDGVSSFYTTKDGKYTIFEGIKMVTRFGMIIRIWENSLYILDNETWKVKQIFIKELNLDDKLMQEVKWVVMEK